MAGLVDQLMSTSFGQTLNSKEAEDLVQTAEERTVHPGQCLFETGAAGDALFVILDGSLEVLLGSAGPGATSVATLGAGQVVGELEVMTGSLRVATLLAKTETTVLALSGERLRAMLNENRPAATKLVTFIARTLARRLAAVNQRIVAKPATGTRTTTHPAAPATQPPQEAAPTEISDAELVPVDDDDLEVLDRLWG